MEKEKGIIIRFVIGHRYIYLIGICVFTCFEIIVLIFMRLNSPFHSATPGGVLDRTIDAEETQHKDFLRLVCCTFSGPLTII